MASWGIILWLVGLSAITFLAVAWLLDISNRQRELQQRFRQLFTDEEGKTAALPLESLLERLDTGEAQTRHWRDELAQLRNSLPRSIQAVSLVRFQAFTDYGGDQSFALALADTLGDGVVLSGIFAREGTRVYAKPLSGWSSNYSLSFEEEEAIKKARNQVQAQPAPQTPESESSRPE
jgi:hypothetical protein